MTSGLAPTSVGLAGPAGGALAIVTGRTEADIDGLASAAPAPGQRAHGAQYRLADGSHTTGAAPRPGPRRFRPPVTWPPSTPVCWWRPSAPAWPPSNITPPINELGMK